MTEQAFVEYPVEEEDRLEWEAKHHAAQSYYNKLWLKLAVGLRQQAARRAARAQGRNIEANVKQAAGSFHAFNRELKRENGRLFAEMVSLMAWHLEQVKALPCVRCEEVKALPVGNHHEDPPCPACNAPLFAIEGGFACYQCGARFGVSRSGQIFFNHLPGFSPRS